MLKLDEINKEIAKRENGNTDMEAERTAIENMLQSLSPSKLRG
jgi:hypothetical protein